MFPRCLEAVDLTSCKTHMDTYPSLYMWDNKKIICLISYFILKVHGNLSSTKAITSFWKTTNNIYNRQHLDYLHDTFSMVAYLWKGKSAPWIVSKIMNIWDLTNIFTNTFLIQPIMSFRFSICITIPGKKIISEEEKKKIASLSKDMSERKSPPHAW